jgi:basic amino acid/polyamine antiporter, APA family
LPGAVLLGLGSMLGTGVFVSLGFSVELAGVWVLPAILVAGAIALCNALSSAQLAAAFPVAGGTYEYGYRTLTPTLGFVAGWTFLLAKTASAAAASLALADLFIRILSLDRSIAPVGVAVVVCAVLTCGVLLGLRRTNVLNAVLVCLTLAGLAWFVMRLFPHRLWRPPQTYVFATPDWATFFQVVALTFVAFTGYGRLATLGEEVRRPRVTIPRAIAITVGVCLLIYLLVAASLLQSLVIWPKDGVPTVISVTENNLRFGVDQPLVLTAALSALAGVLLNLILGLSRVWLAMGRRGDMPALLARVRESTSTPVPAVVVTSVAIILFIVIGKDIQLVWSFSAFSVLLYYGLTNLAALRLPREQRLYPAWIAWSGLMACLTLAWFVEWQVVAGASALIAAAVVVRRLSFLVRGL